MAESIVAKVQPLQGKHYGTTVNVTLPNGKIYGINVWIPYGPPSNEDLEGWGITSDQWAANVEVGDGWGGTEPIQRMHPCDQHYQSELEKVVAQHIEYALNVLPTPVPEVAA